MILRARFAIPLVLLLLLTGCASAEAPSRPTAESVQQLRGFRDLGSGNFAAIGGGEVLVHRLVDGSFETTAFRSTEGELGGRVFSDPGGTSIAAATPSELWVWDLATGESTARAPLPAGFVPVVFTGTTIRGIDGIDRTEWSTDWVEIDVTTGAQLRTLVIPPLARVHMTAIRDAGSIFDVFDTGYRATGPRVFVDPWSDGDSAPTMPFRDFDDARVLAVEHDEVMVVGRDGTLHWFRDPLGASEALPLPPRTEVEQVLSWAAVGDDALVVLTSSLRRSEVPNIGRQPKSLLIYQRAAGGWTVDAVRSLRAGAVTHVASAGGESVVAASNRLQISGDTLDTLATVRSTIVELWTIEELLGEFEGSPVERVD